MPSFIVADGSRNTTDALGTSLRAEEDGFCLTRSLIDLLCLVSFRLQDGRLLQTFGDVDSGLTRTCSNVE